jgi:hypothetical protein
MRRSFVRKVARALAGVVLLAQMSIVAYACPGVTLALQAGLRAPAVEAPTAGEAATGAPGCEDMVGAMDPTSANLCAEHCKYGQQSDQASTVNVPAAALVALYATPAAPVSVPPPRPTAASMSALVAASPPHAILHCVYRI